MKNGKIVLIAIAILAVAFFIISPFSKGCDTASKMADQTVFNADKNVWTYENFHAQHSQYEQYGKQLKEVEEKIDTLQAKGITSGQRYDNLTTEADGIRNMIHRIAADYNKASDVWYQDIWKSKGLPKRLE